MMRQQGFSKAGNSQRFTTHHTRTVRGLGVGLALAMQGNSKAAGDSHINKSLRTAWP